VKEAEHLQKEKYFLMRQSTLIRSDPSCLNVCSPQDLRQHKKLQNLT